MIQHKYGPVCIGFIATKTLTFIQLVQQGIFIADGEKKNWCFDEYQTFINSIKNQFENHNEYNKVFKNSFKPLLAGNDKKVIIPAELPCDFRSWKDHIFECALNETLPTDPDDFRTIISNIANIIVDLKHQIISCVPS